MEIGSEFSNIHADINRGSQKAWLPYGADHVFVFSGTGALETVLKDIQRDGRKALIPSYCCSSMLKPFVTMGYAIDLYPVHMAENFTIELDIPEDCAVLLWCNYFGFEAGYPAEKIAAFRRRGGIVIEDITHSLLSDLQYHPESDYLVASLRKWGAVISGGFCSKTEGKFVRKPVQYPDELFLNKKKEAMGLKEEYLRAVDPKKKERFLQLFVETNYTLEKCYSDLAIDEESKVWVENWDVEKIRSVRRSNAEILYQGLKNCRFMTPLFQMEDMDCPLFVPAYVEPEHRDSLRKVLSGSEVYCPVHWRRPKQLECSSNLYDGELSLVCDQRYSEADMQRLIAVLQSYDRNQKENIL